MNVYAINDHWLICAESATIAYNLAQIKFGEIWSVKLFRSVS